MPDKHYDIQTDTSRLTASRICREALSILQRSWDAPQREWPPCGVRFDTPVKGLHGAIAFIPDDALQANMDSFVADILRPLIEAWAYELRDVGLGAEYLNLPMGVLDAANERLGAVAMRCIITENHPIMEREVPARVARYYDISTDEFKEAPCSMSVSFWVHTIDTDARLFAPDPK